MFLLLFILLVWKTGQLLTSFSQRINLLRVRHNSLKLPATSIKVQMVTFCCSRSHGCDSSLPEVSLLISDVNYFVRFATIILSGFRLPVFFAFFLLIFLVFLLHFRDFSDGPIVDNRWTVVVVLFSRFLSGDAQ